jgi:outer membrane receptor protein involved in Fe transport
MKRHLLLSTAVTGLMVSLSGTAAMAQEAQAGTTEEEGRGIGDIVVTASRREEKMQDVAVTVQALGGEQLAERGITSFSQLLKELPQVQASGRGPGQNSVSIRGLNLAQIGLQGSALAGTAPTVAIYLDDASVAMPGRNLDVYVTDLERVEVLEGPQGTLFGASAEGGAIRYITNKPNLNKFQAGVTLNGAATPGHEYSMAVNGYINVPIIEDKLAIRVTAFVDRQGGYIDNIAATYQMPLVGFNSDGTIAYCLPGAPAAQCGAANAARPVATRPTINNAAFAKDDFNPATYAGGRVSLKWEVAPDWTIGVQHMYQSLEAEGVFQYDPTLGDLKVKRFSPDTNHDSFHQTQWSIEGKLGGLDLVYSGTYLDRKIEQKFDYTRYAEVGPFVPYYICTYPGYAACQTPRMTYLDHSKNTRFTQEFRIATPADKRFRVQAGVYYDKTEVLADNVFYYEGAAAIGFKGQRPGGGEKIRDYFRPDGGVYFNDAIRGESQFALFGEASFDITEKLTLTAGLRWYNQETSLRGSVNCGGLATINNVLPNGKTCSRGNYAVSLAGKTPAHEKGVTPKITLSYKPNDDVLIYATFSEGYRPGGFNRRGGTGNGFTVPFTYNSDSVKNYEIGWKTEFANRTLRWNGSAFYIDWTGIPVSIYAPAISNSTFIINGPSARVKGVTTDLTWRATEELTITANVAYNDSELSDFGTTPAGFQPQPGDPARKLTFKPLGSPLSQIPKWNSGLRIRYETENSAGTRFYGHAGGQFVGSSRNSTVKTYDDPLPGYAQFDAGVGVKKDSWSAELYVQNLTDKRPLTAISVGDNVPLNSTSRPRTIGLRFSWNTD